MFSKLFKKILIITGTLFLFFASLPVYADEDIYYVVDFSNERSIIGEYDSFKRANNAYTKEIDNYENLGILFNDKILEIEYGIVKLNHTEACDVNVLFTYDVSQLQGYTNGCYGVDGAYFGTRDNGNEIGFVLSGAKGWANKDDVEIIPYEEITTRISNYLVQEGTLYHQIKGSMDTDNYAAIIEIGNVNLSDGTYYSYDGHYFYDENSFKVMVDDYRNDSYANSLNNADPYFNYYQYLPHRTLTNIRLEDIKNYFANDLGINGNIISYQDDEKDSADDTLTKSQYYNHLDAFYQGQYEFGANALMMLSLSSNESAYGHSSLSFTRNNLFGHAAYDTDVEANASRYFNVDNSIYSHAKYYISGSYASPLKSQYHGSHFGDKESGMNVSYASDPYWGEKAASYYMQFDRIFGNTDKDSYALAIKQNYSSIPIYNNPSDSSQVIFNTGEENNLSFVVLDEMDGWLKIQCDATFDESGVNLDYYYDYDNHVGYIRRSDISFVLNEDKINNDKEYVNVTFDSNGGMFTSNDSIITYELHQNNSLAITNPTKDNSLFVGWDKQLPEYLDHDETFIAQYKDVDRIEISSFPKQAYELRDRVDLKNGFITVYFTDGSTQDYQITTDMISGYDMNQDGNQSITVRFAGCETSYDISVSEQLDTLREDIRQEILSIIEKYKDTDTLSDSEKEEVLSLKNKIDSNMLPYLTQAQLRELDNIVRKSIGDDIRYSIEKNNYDMQVSGLSVSIPFEDSLEKRKYLEDTYRMSIDTSVSSNAEKAFSKQAVFYNSDIEDSFKVELRKNFDLYDYDRPIIVTIKKPDTFESGDVYTVLYFDKETGDVKRCYTRQTANTISFMTRGNGEYCLLSRLTSNMYVDEDPVETISDDSVSTDYAKYRVYISLLSIALFLLALLLLRYRNKRKRRKIKERRQSRKIDDDSEVAKALELYETTILKIDDVNKDDK